MSPSPQVLEDADLKKTDIDEIVLVGGSTRIPKVVQLLKDFFNGKACISELTRNVLYWFYTSIKASRLSPHTFYPFLNLLFAGAVARHQP